ncbi:PREDICTED: HAUS augmin-like complex subunit 1 [Acropora digitifera]|uniref:HAUS augmin-like complex subunit 1 n=1 Tax=Acropora digitifera TaxID=70779 RepID=UPI00077A56CA|nr:PREDICTED: HAUS augmin-like complex subunit 1 [Acropora digitifera]
MASNRYSEDDIGRHTKVFSWLQQVFGEDSIPQFEINNFTLGILEKLANINQEQNKHGEIITKDYIQKCSEYAAEAERLSRITEHIGLPVSCMSQSGRTSLKTLASVALLLATKNCSTSSLLLGIAQQSQALSDAVHANYEEKQLLSRLLSKTKIAQSNSSDLQRSLDGLKDLAASQAPKLKKNETETDFVRLKCKEYEKTNRELEIYQGKLQLDSSIFHDTLVKKSQDVRTIHEKIKPVKEKLEVYHSLPPDISQARVMVGEAKMQLEMLERQLSLSIDTLHL